MIVPPPPPPRTFSSSAIVRMVEEVLKISAVGKLLEYVASGVGAVAGPMMADWKARRDGKARLTSARYDAEVRRIDTASHAQALVIIADAQKSARQSLEQGVDTGHGRMEITREDITQSIEFQTRKRLANVRSVVEDAADQLGDDQVADHEPDDDWTARFFDDVQDVSSEDMRKIWARILAGEVKDPGRTSLRTLETLRNMTKRDAEVFQHFCAYVMNSEFVFHQRESYGGGPPLYEALSLTNLLQLQEWGLISAERELIRNLSWDSFGRIYLGYVRGMLQITKTKDHDRDLAFPVISLTSVGRELCPAVDSTSRMDYLQAFAKYLEPMGRQLEYLEGIEPFPDGRGIEFSKHTRIRPISDLESQA